MSASISGDIIVGNFIVGLLEKEKFSFSMDEICEFDKKLSEKLKEKDNFYSTFIPFDVFSFYENYPFFMEQVIDKKTFIIIRKERFTHGFYKLAVRYFRMGLQKELVQDITDVMNSMYVKGIKNNE